MSWILLAMITIIALILWIRIEPDWHIHLIDNKQQHHRCRIQVNYEINEPIVIKFRYEAKRPITFTHALVTSPFLQRYYIFEHTLDHRDAIDGKYTLCLKDDFSEPRRTYHE